jgi:site-specific DNA recombinase
MTRAAIHARYSTDLQRDASIEDQIRVCQERIEREGWRLVATNTDRAISGADRSRPGYQKLIEDAAKMPSILSLQKHLTAYREIRTV